MGMKKKGYILRLLTFFAVVFSVMTLSHPQTVVAAAKDRSASELSLAGEWELKLGAYSSSDETLSDTCTLPGTLDENQKGTKNTAGDENRLSRKYKYTGYAV